MGSGSSMGSTGSDGAVGGGSLMRGTSSVAAFLFRGLMGESGGEIGVFRLCRCSPSSWVSSRASWSETARRYSISSGSESHDT